MDAEAVVLAIDLSHGERLSVMSHQAYGPVTGYPGSWRCSSVKRSRRPSSALATPPSATRSCCDGWPTRATRSPTTATCTRRSGDVGRGRGGDARSRARGARAVTGRRPVGYRAPMWETTYAHTATVARSRLRLRLEPDGRRVPYELAERPGDGARSLVEIPVHWALDDWEQYAYLPEAFGSGLIEDPAKVLSMWTAELAAFHDHGACFTLTNHPFLSGRLGRLRAMETLIETMHALPGLWIATAGRWQRTSEGSAWRLAPSRSRSSTRDPARSRTRVPERQRERRRDRRPGQRHGGPPLRRRADVRPAAAHRRGGRLRRRRARRAVRRRRVLPAGRAFRALPRSASPRDIFARRTTRTSRSRRSASSRSRTPATSRCNPFDIDDGPRTRSSRCPRPAQRPAPPADDRRRPHDRAAAAAGGARRARPGRRGPLRRAPGHLGHLLRRRVHPRHPVPAGVRGGAARRSGCLHVGIRGPLYSACRPGRGRRAWLPDRPRPGPRPTSASAASSRGSGRGWGPAGLPVHRHRRPRPGVRPRHRNPRDGRAHSRASCSPPARRSPAAWSGADVVEVAPAYDHAEITSLAAATVAFEMASVMARARQGRNSTDL